MLVFAVIILAIIIGSWLATSGLFTNVDPKHTGLTRLRFQDMAHAHMDSTANLMVFAGVVSFKRPLERPEVLEMLKRLPRRFRERVVPPLKDVSEASSIPFLGNTRYWAPEEPGFEEDWHLTELDLVEWCKRLEGDAVADGHIETTGLTSANLRRFISHTWHQQFDPNHSLWRMYLLHDSSEGLHYLLWRIHHCMGDGQAVIASMLAMTDPEPNPDNSKPLEAKPIWESQGQKRRMKAGHTNALRYLYYVPMGIVEVLYQLVKLVFSFSDPTCIFKQWKLSGVKTVASTNPINVDDIKAIKNHFDVTVNDVLVSCFVGAMRRYLKAVQPGRLWPEGDVKVIRALVAVDTAGPSRDLNAMGNSIALVYQDLPIHMEDPIQRLGEVNKIMTYIKSSKVYVPLYSILFWLLGVVPLKVQIILVNWFCSKASLVLTNVIGPITPRYVAEVPMAHWVFWPAIASTLGVGVGMGSYNGQCSINFQVDSALFTDTERLAAFADAEVTELLEIVDEK